MTPFRMAQQVYERELCKRDFWTDLHLHMNGGYVVITPDVFLMGRAVEKNAPYSKITDPSYKFESPDAWLVYLAAGNGLSAFFKYEPYALDWIGWERANILRFHSAERLRKRYASQLKN